MASETKAEGSWVLPRPRALPELVAERIVEAIRTGELRPGERIVENRLAKRLGLSRAPLREALRALEANHILENRRGRGTYVAAVAPDQITHMVTMRAVLEGLAARLVAERRTPEMIETLTAHHRDITRAAEAGETSRWRDLDWRFHETVCAMSGNEFLLRAWQSISNLVRLFLHSHPGFEIDAGRILDHHEQFLAVLRDGSPDEAEQVFRGIILKSAAMRSTAPPSPAARSGRKPSRASV